MLLGASCVPAHAQVTLAPNWYQQSPAASPPPRDTLGLVYDPKHQQVVMFGGYNGSYLNDTWLFDGTTWTQASPANSPSPRSNVEMVYDPATGNVVLFGGLYNASTRYDDTWTWDGTNWTLLSPATTPGGRASASMVYDAATGNVVMFGGLSNAGMFLNDTWTWNGTTWTQASPSASPSARAAYSMAYDAAHGQVVLFGGLEYSSGFVDLNDTWTWDGTNWTQKSPANVPPVRDTAAMAYDPAQGQVVLFGGLNDPADTYLGDTWVWNGTNWTELSPASSPSARYAGNGIDYDAAQGQLILFGGADSSTVFNDTWYWGLPQNFGNINVCPSGQSTPAPCSDTIALTYNVATTTTFGTTPQVVTQGASGLDFTLASGNTCMGTVSPGTCTVNVTFTPIAPGLRQGAVQLFDNVGNLLVSTAISGVGQGPAVAFAPGTQTTVPTSGLQYPDGVAVDAAGNVFIADYVADTVVKVTPGGVQSTVSATGLQAPIGVAVDGAGDLFIVDLNLPYAVKLPPSGVQTTVGSGLNFPVGVAVDGAGDVFIGDQNNDRVVEVTPSGVQTTVPATGLNQPWGVAVDGAGDVFIADGPPEGFSNGKVVEVTPSGVQTTVPTTGLKQPYDLAVDAAGDVFIADPQNFRVLEITPSGVQTTFGSGLNYPSGVAVDAAGDLFFGDQGAGQVYEVNRSQTPSLSFETTYVGFTSSDSPQSITLQNIGNQTLNAVSPGLLVVTGPNFSNTAGPGTPPDCSASYMFTPGQSCDLSVNFTPQSAGSLSSTAVFNDNALNANHATQTVSLSGAGLNQVESLNVAGAGTGNGSIASSPGALNCGILGGVASGPTCSASLPGGTGVSLEEVPSSGYVFAGWGGACLGQGTSQFCNISTNVGSATNVTASFAPSTNYTLTLTEVGNGTGSVSDNQSQISCSLANGSVSGTCAGTYSNGTNVTLTANATGNTTFAGWGGACASSGTSAFCTVTMNSAQSVSASFVAPGATQAGTLKPITAGVVYGQGGSFTTNVANNGGLSANSLFALGGLAFDASGNLYVADCGNNRVLFYPAGSTTATRVYGQNGSFTSNTANNGGVSANSLSTPQGVALDSSGNLYVADEYNNRVLFYPAGSTTATRVYGQGGSFTTNTENNGGVSANSLGQPYGLALDSSGNLYVGDYQNNRVLFYPAGSTTATRVYGQGGSFTSNNVNNGGVSANSLDQPTGVALDSSGDLYVADIYNNRVLFYPYNSTTATQVYGQGGSFTTNYADNGGISANSLNNPMYVALDSSGDLYVVDRSNNRMLFYSFGSTTATRVYGQLNSLTATTANNGGVSANSFSQPWAVALDPSGRVFVTDYSNNRVLEYGSFGNVNVCPAGVNTPAPCNNTVTMSYYAATATNFGATQVVTQGTSGLDFTLGSGGTCTGQVSAGSTCSVNVNFAPLAPGSRTGAVELFDNNANLLTSAPAYGIAQAPAIAFGPGTQATVNTGSYTLRNPRGMLFDAAGNLFISDVTNLQVLKIAPNGNVSSVGFGFQFPQGLAEDGAGDLFVADNNLNELVEIPAGCASINCQVYLGNNFRSQLGVAVDGAGDVFFGDFEDGAAVEIPAGCTGTACQKVVYNPGGGSHPVDLTADAAGDLFVADFGLQRVIEVPAGCANSSCQISIGSGWSQPDDVAVDAAGDVFVADQGLQAVVEVPAGCAIPACQVTVVSGVNTVAVAVDASGDLVVDDLNTPRVFEINRSQLPSLSFAVTSVGGISAPQSVSVQNVGNQPLTGSLVSSLGTNFTQNSTPDCSSEFPLAPGASCNESFSFTPQTTGYLTGAASFSDNTLNLSSSVVLQTINLSGIAGATGQTGATIPDVVGMTEAAAATVLTGTGLTVGAVSSEYSSSQPSGSVVGESPAAGTPASLGAAVALRISTGQAPPQTPNPLNFENNYFVTGDYATAGVTLAGTGTGGVATGTITIPDLTTCNCGQGVPDGADIVDGFLYWTTVENTPAPSGNTGTFLGYAITGQQVGSDVPSYTDPVTQMSGTLRVYRADVNSYFQGAANGSGVRTGSGSFTVSLPGSGGTSPLPITTGASLVVIYRVLSPNFPLKAVVIYDGSTVPGSSTTQNMQGFYDAVGGASGTGESTPIYYSSTGTWNGSPASVTLGAGNQYTAPLSAGFAYAAEILSTPVNNSDNDGILDAWKTGPTSGFFVGQPGYYDVKSQSWVPLPGAKHGEKDLFVQLDWMCGNVLASGACDPTQENLFPSPDADGNDPLAMVQQAFANTGIVLHLEVGNAVPENTCTDNTATVSPQLCQFPGEPGVIGWKNSLEFSKVWPRNFTACAAGGDCTARFPYGQKDSYHYVLVGHSLAIPAWNSRYGTLTAISTSPSTGQTTISTTNRGAEGSINYCPSRFTISGVLSNPGLNGVYNTVSCPDAQTIILSTPGVTNWTYTYATNTPPEPEIGLTSGTVTSISGYSDLGGADSAVTLALWETAPNQDMSKRAQVVAGTLFHEIGHTLGLPHGGLYYDKAPSYVPTFEANCKPNYQSSMNYLFQLDGVGPNSAIAYSNQQLDYEPQSGPPAIALSQGSVGSAYELTDPSGAPATFSTSTWYTPIAPSSTVSPATMHCDGTPLAGDTGYRVTGSIAPITPAWTAGQNITFDGVSNTTPSTLRGFNDVASIDMRQVGATGGEFASLAGTLSFGNSSAPLSVAPGGSLAVGAGGAVTLGAHGTMTLTSGGNVTLGSGAVISNSSTITLGTGGTATVPSSTTVTPGTNGVVGLPNGGSVTLNGPGPFTLSGGGTIALGAGGLVTLGAGGTIVSSAGTVTIPSSGGSYTLPAGGGTVTPSAGGNVTLGAGGNVTLGAGGNVTLGAGGNVTLGAGGNVTLGAGGLVALGAGGNVTLGAGGNITLGAGGVVALGAGGTVTLGAGGNVTLGAGGIVALGAGGNVTLGAGGNVTLGAGGNVTLGAGGNVTLGAGGNVTLGAGGLVALGAGGNITLGAGGNITLGAGGLVTLGAGGTVTPNGGSPVQVGAGGSYTLPAGGGTITLGAGGSATLPSGGGVVALGAGGNITLGAGGNVTLGAGGNVTLGAGGVVALGAGGNVTLGAGGNIALGAGGNVTLGGGGVTTNELDYETANSIVRPPPSATYSMAPSNSVQVNWTAPAFGVVQSYTISRSVVDSMGNVLVPPTVIGSVSGVGGYPPATTFTDTTPPSGTLVYTIATALVPDTPVSQPRQSVPSPPAVLTINQSIVLGSLPSPVLISSSPVTVTATAESNNLPNGLQVNFSATGPCSIVSGSQSVTPVVNNSGGVSSASVTLSGTGTCTITASQAGNSTTVQGNETAYNAATPVSAAFVIVNQNSSTTPQAITFPQLPNVQYGSGFSVSASSTSGLTVRLSTPPNAPCVLNNVVTANGTTTATGTTTGAGQCTITASAPAGPGSNNTTYSAASLSQSFSVSPAVISVTAASFTITYGHAIPTLTYALSGYVNGDSASVVSGTPSLSTTATSTSSPSFYPITVTAGTLAAANYSFSFVNGTVTIQQAAQATLTVTGMPQTAQAYNATFTVGSSGGSGTGAVTFASTGACSVVPSTGLVSMTSGTGTCSVTATKAADTNYNSTTSAAATVSATLAAQTTLTVTGMPQTAQAYNATFTVGSSGGSGTGVVTFASTGACSVVPSTGLVTMTSGTGTCSVTATKAADTNYNSNTSAAATVGATVAAQTITFTTSAPSTAAYNSQFVVAATASSGLAVTFTSSGVCSNSGATYTMTNSTGTCTVIANQAGNTNYAAAPPKTEAVSATGPGVTVSPSSINFGTVTQGSITTESITVSNSGNAAVTINQPLISIVQGGNSNEFVAVNLCPSSLAAGKSCTISISFVAGPYYTPQTATLEIMDNAPGSPQAVTMSATVLIPQTITFTTSAPSSAAYKSSFTVAATGGASGNAVTFTSSGSCSNSGAKYTMTSGTGTCSVIANQAGNATYAAAPQVTQSVTASKIAPTVTFTGAPASAAYKSSFTVASTTNASTTAAITGSGACSNIGTSVTMTSGTGTCSLAATWAADSNYNSATATQSTTASKIAPTVTFTGAPASAAYKSSFTVASTTNASTTAAITSSGSCSNSGTSVTMTSGTGTCSLTATWAADSNYNNATATQSTTATLAPQTIKFTTNAPSSAAYKSSFTVAATGGASGNAVTYTSSGSCSNSGATFTMTSGTGTCSVIANQAGATNEYSAATQVTQTVTATLAAQTITFTTSAPSSAVYKSSFTVAATGGASGNAVTFTSSGSCSNSGATYTMTSGTGTCSVIANQAGTTNDYSAAPQVTQTVTAAYAVASLSPASLSFGTVSSGKSSTAQTVTLSNTGSTPLIVSSIGFTGTNPSSFTQTNTCPSSSTSLAAGKSCTISVTFNSSGKAVTANLAVTDNTQTGTQTVSLSGN
jgi:sugar lactone lactonase YvrE/uncharacterized protein (DUF2345 family)